MTGWNRIERGTGRPLVLLHGGGASASCWLPVLDQLSVDRRVLALDFPGHGETPAPGPDIEVDLPWLTEELGIELRRLGINGPVDLVGNSLGGLVALEAAKRGLASTVVALSPAGLWRNGMPLRLQLIFRTGLLGARLTRTRAGALLGRKMMRALTLWPVVAKPQQLSPAEAIDLARDLDRSGPTLRRALQVAKSMSFQGGQAITVPVTIAFGAIDRMVPPRSKHYPELPAQARKIILPGCGHVPMWDAPQLIVDTIRDGISPAHPVQQSAV
ncbi:alpha/beta fold hydrolase [Nocardia altamirensis]|uniref:alpha/beta fold hydrolase n=1 Tax=Nocardia altamirensis TaxID=472158 RepID=UPI0008403BD2|nr:alpha/beta fold hydrolase [Nocardia altamirensis]